MKLQSLKASTLLALSLLTLFCAAGPLAALGPMLAPVFGMVASTCWIDGFVVAYPIIFWTSSTVSVAVGAGVVGGSVAAGVVVEQGKADAAAKAKSSASSLSSGSSVSSASKWSMFLLSTSAVAAASHSSVSSQFNELQKSAVASATAKLEASDSSKPDTAKNVFTFFPRSVTTPVSSQTSVIPSGVPPGVPEYNFRLCQKDLGAMGTAKQNITMSQPEAQSKY